MTIATERPHDRGTSIARLSCADEMHSIAHVHNRERASADSISVSLRVSEAKPSIYYRALPVANTTLASCTLKTRLLLIKSCSNSFEFVQLRMMKC